jgi:hypothetical protein
MKPKYLLLIILFAIHYFSSGLQAQHNRMQKDSADFVIRSLTTHSLSSNFSAVAYRNGIVFCSDRPRETGVVHFDSESKQGLLDLYTAQLKDSFSLVNVHSFSDTINTIFHEGPASFSADGNTIYYGSSGQPPHKDLPQILESQRSASGWSIPKRVCGPDSTMPMAHPAISPDGKTLYFCSTIKSGRGRSDIYSMVKTGGVWSAPENLGPEINTPGNECFPFVDAKNKLYFSSDGQPESEKLDVFAADRNGFGRYSIRRLASPLNSAGDDFGFSTDSLGIRGFVSSNRGGNKDEIYVFYNTRPVFCNCEEMKPDQNCFTFYEEKSAGSANAAGITYEWNFGDSTKANGLEVDHCFKNPGLYTVELNVVDSTTGVLFYNQSSYQISVGSSSQLHFEIPDTVLAGSSVLLDASTSSVKNNTIENYYWDTGDGKNTRGPLSSVTFAIPGEKTIRLGCTARNKNTGKTNGYCKWKHVTVLPEKKR